MSRRCGGRRFRAANRATSATKCSIGQRLNGLPALTCTTTIWSPARTPARARRSSTAAVATASAGISTPSIERSGGAMSNAVNRSHWFSTECRRRSSRGRRDAARVHPATARNLVPDPDRRAAQPRQQRRPRPAVKVDGDVVARGACSRRPSATSAITPAQSARARSDDDVVEMRVVQHDRRSRRFDDVGEMSIGKPTAQRVNRRRRENHVANLPEANEEDS